MVLRNQIKMLTQQTQGDIQKNAQGFILKKHSRFFLHLVHLDEPINFPGSEKGYS